MAEKPIADGPSDYGYVDLRSGPERRYWINELGCTEQQLVDAVGAVGPLVVEVKRYIGSRLECSDAEPDSAPAPH